MLQFIEMFFALWAGFLTKLDAVIIDLSFAGYYFDVSLLSVLTAFLVFAILIGVFWKGAKA